jgi:hypothetical protein
MSAKSTMKDILAARLASVLVAAEYGYKSAERGENLQQCMMDVKRIWLGEEKKNFPRTRKRG